MQYAKFSSEDLKAINEFAAKHPRHKANVFENSITFVYDDKTEEEDRREEVVEALKKERQDLEVQIALQHLEVEHARGEAKATAKGEHKVVEAEGVKAPMLRKLEVLKKLIKAVEAGEYAL